MGDAVKWGERGRRVDMCLDNGECEKATRATVLVATQMCSSYRLPCPGSPNTKFRAHFNFDKTSLICTKNTSNLVKSISNIQRYGFVTSGEKND